MPDSPPTRGNKKCANCGATIRPGSLTAWIFGRDPQRCNCETPAQAEPETQAPHSPSTATAAIIDAELHIAVGDCIAGRYQILKAVGQGANGAVFKAYDQRFDGQVAIKTLRPSLISDESALRRFEREAQAASTLSHPNLVKVHDFGVENKLSYIVMDYLDGENIAEMVDHRGPLEPQRAIKIFLQVCQGIGYAHDKGALHRDLKPSNIVVQTAPDGTDLVKIVDFGIAKLAPTPTSDDSKLTESGEVFGSPYYMSPEQCRGDTLDARSDLYSLGCAMFEALTGTPPFQGENPIKVILNHLNQDPDELFNPFAALKIPSSLQSVVIRCLDKNPARRYQSAGALERDLIGARVGQVIKREKKARALPGKTALAATVGLLVGLSFALFLLLKDQSAAVKERNESVPDAWREADRAGQNSFDRGDYTAALNSFNHSLQLVEGKEEFANLAGASLNELLDLCRAKWDSKQAQSIQEKLRALQPEVDRSGRPVEKELQQMLAGGSAAHAAPLIRVALSVADDLSQSGDFDGAERIYSQCLPICARDAALAPLKITCLHSQGVNHYKQRQYSRALLAFQQALKLEEKSLSPDDPVYAATLIELGRVGAESGLVAPKQAESYLMCGIDVYGKSLAPTSEKIAQAQLLLARLHLQDGKNDQANREAGAALSIFHGQPEPNRTDEARCLAIEGGAQKNAAELQRALTIFESTIQKDYPDLEFTLVELASALKSDNPQLAASCMRRAWAVSIRLGDLEQSRCMERAHHLGLEI